MLSDDYYDEDYSDDDPGISDDEETLMNCAMLRDGSCMAAGSEECDWECPLGPLRNPMHWGLK